MQCSCRCTNCAFALRRTGGTFVAHVPARTWMARQPRTFGLHRQRQLTDTRQLTDDQQPPPETTPDSNSIFSQLRASHRTTTSLLLNLEAAVNNLAGQVPRAEEVRGDVTAQLVNTLCTGYQDMQPTATSDKVTQTQVTTSSSTVMADRAVQVRGRALPWLTEPCKSVVEPCHG